MKWLIIVAVIVVLDTLFAIALITVLVRKGWNELSREHPPRPAAPDAVERKFQSFRLGLLNLGYCVHVAVDDRYLHLTPARVVRLAGAEPTSIPWDAMEVRHRPRRGRYTTVAIGRQQLVGPSWCLDLVEPVREE